MTKKKASEKGKSVSRRPKKTNTKTPEVLTPLEPEILEKILVEKGVNEEVVKTVSLEFVAQSSRSIEQYSAPLPPAEHFRMY